MSINWPIVEYQNALCEFNGNKEEAILQRIIANPLYVYKLVKGMNKIKTAVYILMLDK